MTCMHSCHQIRFCSCCFDDSDDDDDNEGAGRVGRSSERFSCASNDHHQVGAMSVA